MPVSEGWAIEKAEIDDNSSKVTIYLSYKLDEVNIEGKAYPIYDFRTERNWRHLDLWQYKTYISCRVPRYKDSDGKVKGVQVPWADSNERISWLLEKKR